jgi:uncharacterized protein (TIGR03067 family)
MNRLTALLAGLLLVAPGLAPGDGPSDKAKAAAEELRRLDGTWEVEALVTDGQETRRPTRGHTRLTLKGGKFTYLFKDGTVADDGTVAVDPTATPKTIDISGRGNADVPGVYELKKDELRIYVAPPGKPRPPKLESKEGSGHILFIYKRVE